MSNFNFNEFQKLANLSMTAANTRKIAKELERARKERELERDVAERSASQSHYSNNVYSVSIIKTWKEENSKKLLKKHRDNLDNSIYAMSYYEALADRSQIRHARLQRIILLISTAAIVILAITFNSLWTGILALIITCSSLANEAIWYFIKRNLAYCSSVSAQSDHSFKQWINHVVTFIAEKMAAGSELAKKKAASEAEREDGLVDKERAAERRKAQRNKTVNNVIQTPQDTENQEVPAPDKIHMDAFRAKYPFVQFDVPTCCMTTFLNECNWYKDRTGVYPGIPDLRAILDEIEKNLNKK